MVLRIFIFVCFSSLFCFSQAASDPVAKQNIVDHHVHVLSPQLISLWKGMGIPFSKKDHFYSNIDSIRNLSGVQSMNLISMAHVYSSEEFGGDTSNVYEKIKNENNYLASLKEKYPKHISAYYGIDPLHTNALEEIKRCHSTLKLDGIKLHFNASQVYLTVQKHLEKVREIFFYASEQRIPIILHFDNSHRKFGRRDVNILADSILSGLNFIDLQIAHFGTSGGFNQKTKDVIDAFVDLFNQNHPIKKQRIVFDISAVALDKDGNGVRRLTEEEFKDLSIYCRKLGFDRIVFGTDYPLYNSLEYLDILRKKLHLSIQESDQLLRKK